MNKNKSFTLIEILVVIVVIGIISSFIIVGLSSVSGKANIAKGQAFSNSLRNSLLMNLVSEWKLDGNANDSWGTNNGTNNGATSVSSGCIQGSCYSFNGTSNFIEIPHNANLKPTTKITFSAWASTTDWYVTDKRILSCTEGGGYNINLNQNNGWVSLYVNGGYMTPAFYTTAPSSGWHFFLTTYDGRYLKTYLDGVYKNQYDAGATFPITYVNNNSLIIGGEASTGTGCAGGYFTGNIDNVIIYNDAIPTSQIQQNYFIGLNKLFKNKGIVLNEFNQRLTELKSNITNK
jgi:prepilin-type N-terminal cleavage/methylation domain-containing protein